MRQQVRRTALRALFSYAETRGWILICSPYILSEVSSNLSRLPALAATDWLWIRPQMIVVDDVVTMDWPVIFTASKDRPVLFTASADVLLTLDKADFADVLGRTFYGFERAVAVRLSSAGARKWTAVESHQPFITCARRRASQHRLGSAGESRQAPRSVRALGRNLHSPRGWTLVSQSLHELID